MLEQYENPRRKIFDHLFRKRRLKPKEKKCKIEELHSFLAGKQDKVGKEKLSSQADILSKINKELTNFENTSEWPAILEKVFCAIKTLPPTTVEAERAFSAAGMFVTKLRSRLSEKTIDALIFLRKNLKSE